MKGRQALNSNNSEVFDKEMSDTETRLLIEDAASNRKKYFRTTTSSLPKSVLIMVGLVHVGVIVYAFYSVTKGRVGSSQSEESALEAFLEQELAIDRGVTCNYNNRFSGNNAQSFRELSFVWAKF